MPFGVATAEEQEVMEWLQKRKMQYNFRPGEEMPFVLFAGGEPMIGVAFEEQPVEDIQVLVVSRVTPKEDLDRWANG